MLEKLQEIIKMYLYDDSIVINEEESLYDIPGWDELDTAELYMLLED